MVDNDEKRNNTNPAWWQPALILFVRFSAWIAFPVIIGAFLGKWLDRKFGTEPWLFLSCVGLAFTISMFGLVKNVMEEYAKIEKEGKKKGGDDEEVKSKK